MGFLLFFFCLPFPFLMFACLFETNFPNIPFLKPKLLSFLAVYFFLVALLFVFMVYVSAFLFLCWLFFLFFVFVFVFLFLVLLSIYEKKSCFPCNSGVFWVMLVKRVVCFFVLWFCSCLFFLCCLFPFKQNSFIFFCFCVVFLSQD